jgi:predicted phosphodiesterase
VSRKKFSKPPCVGCGGAIPFGRHNNYCSKKCEINQDGYSLSSQYRLSEILTQVAATTAWKPIDLDKELHIVTPRLLVLSDIHCPIQDEKWLSLAIHVGVQLGCEDVLINGDFIDTPTISRHLGSYYRRKQELEDDINAADAVLGVLSKYFKRIFFDTGNHDQRLIKQFGGELSFKRIMKMLGDHKKLIMTERSYCKVNDSVLIVHPRQYKSSRGDLAQKLSLRHQVSILTGHQHHSAMTISPDGKFQSCDVGCLADLTLQDYVRNELTTYCEPVNGFAVVFGNKIQCFDRFTPWELWNLGEVAARYLK